MKKALFFLFFFIFCADAFAYKYKFNPHSGRLDAVGADATSDIGIVCANNEILKYATGTSTWSCAADDSGVAAGDIDAVGDVASGAAFNGTQGTILTFNVATGDTTLAYSAEETLFKLSAGIKTSGDLYVVGDDIFATTNTNRFVFMGDGTNYNPEAIDLGTDTNGNYAASASEGGAATTSVTAGDVEGTDFGTLTDTRSCTYDSANTEIDCDTVASAGSGLPRGNVVAAANGFDLL